MKSLWFILKYSVTELSSITHTHDIFDEETASNHAEFIASFTSVHTPPCLYRCG